MSKNVNKNMLTITAVLLCLYAILMPAFSVTPVAAQRRRALIAIRNDCCCTIQIFVLELTRNGKLVAPSHHYPTDPDHPDAFVIKCSKLAVKSITCTAVPNDLRMYYSACGGKEDIFKIPAPNFKACKWYTLPCPTSATGGETHIAGPPEEKPPKGKASIHFELASVGGTAVPIDMVPVDKLASPTPYIGLASTILVATAATAIYVKRRKKKR